jgi:hypothetical protein
VAKEEKNVIGKDILKAYGRQGLEELRAALPLADSPIAQPTDYGMWGKATPGEVAESRREDVELMDEHSVVGSRINQVMGDTRDKDDRDTSMERE